MIGTNVQAGDVSLVEKGRAFLERGDVLAAVECYGKAFDPESIDELEARNMLIEARSHLGRKHLLEALESFEEALLMGTEVQRRQALEGISQIGEIRARLKRLTAEIKAGLKKYLGDTRPESKGLLLLSNDQNFLVISDDTLSKLPDRLAKGSKMKPVPAHLSDYSLPFAASKCVPYTDDEDVAHILSIAAHVGGGE
jgi:tetratricopeptide (TPR) repeat protein